MLGYNYIYYSKDIPTLNNNDDLVVTKNRVNNIIELLSSISIKNSNYEQFMNLQNSNNNLINKQLETINNSLKYLDERLLLLLNNANNNSNIQEKVEQNIQNNEILKAKIDKFSDKTTSDIKLINDQITTLQNILSQNNNNNNNLEKITEINNQVENIVTNINGFIATSKLNDENIQQEIIQINTNINQLEKTITKIKLNSENNDSSNTNYNETIINLRTIQESISNKINEIIKKTNEYDTNIKNNTTKIEENENKIENLRTKVSEINMASTIEDLKNFKEEINNQLDAFNNILQNQITPDEDNLENNTDLLLQIENQNNTFRKLAEQKIDLLEKKVDDFIKKQQNSGNTANIQELSHYLGELNKKTTYLLEKQQSDYEELKDDLQNFAHNNQNHNPYYPHQNPSAPGGNYQEVSYPNYHNCSSKSNQWAQCYNYYSRANDCLAAPNGGKYDFLKSQLDDMRYKLQESEYNRKLDKLDFKMEMYNQNNCRQGGRYPENTCGPYYSSVHKKGQPVTYVLNYQCENLLCKGRPKNYQSGHSYYSNTQQQPSNGPTYSVYKPPNSSSYSSKYSRYSPYKPNYYSSYRPSYSYNSSKSAGHYSYSQNQNPYANDKTYTVQSYQPQEALYSGYRPSYNDYHHYYDKNSEATINHTPNTNNSDATDTNTSETVVNMVENSVSSAESPAANSPAGESEN